MLLQKPIVAGMVISIKLTSGEELIARYDSDNEQSIVVDKPATIMAGPNGSPSIVPWMMTSRAESIKLNKATVVAYTTTEEDIAKAYTETTTNLKLA
jgi:hypothetical protein